MASGIIAAVIGTGSTAYQPVSDAQVLLSVAAVGSGATLTANNVGFAAGNYKFFVGAGQILTVATFGSASYILSALEE